MFNIGPQELLLILLVALVVVGPKRLPELSRTIGRGLREFRKAQDEVKKTINLGLDESEPTTRARPATAPPGGAGNAAAATGAGNAAAASEATGPEAPVDTAADVARTLGRGLAEIRQARREIQRTFRVDLTDEPPRRPSRRRTSPPASTPTTSPPPASPPPSTPAQTQEEAPAGPETPA